MFCLQNVYLTKTVPFLFGWLGDRLLGDPAGWPHPVIAFGKVIAYGEKQLNKGHNRAFKGGLMAVVMIVAVYFACRVILNLASDISEYLYTIFMTIGVFYCLAGKTLITEVKAVFEAVERNIEEGRHQVSRIVGRDTSDLSAQEIRAAALETLAENLSDGVVAPMFWFILLGLPGMMAYKMVNTLDSMIGYKTERYLAFGKTAARIDDVANYIPARITAVLMLLVSGNLKKIRFVLQFGSAHSSPNSGYPESALAAILNCRFGGTHNYFGEAVVKPYIGTNERPFTIGDMTIAVNVNNNTELASGLIVCILSMIIH